MEMLYTLHNRVEEPLVHLLLTIHNGVCDVAKWAVGHKGVLNLFLIEFRKVLPVTGQLRKLRLDASGAIAPSSVGFSCKIGTDI